MQRKEEVTDTHTHTHTHTHRGHQYILSVNPLNVTIACVQVHSSCPSPVQLQRLLSEQLCDDLLDSEDSSSEDEVSFLSPPHHTHQVRWSSCLSVCPFVCPSVCLSVCPSICLSVRLFFCPSVCLSVRLFVCPSVCLSVCLNSMTLHS